MNDFRNMSDKYKQQMMDLYKKNPQRDISPKPKPIEMDNKNENLSPIPIEENVSQQELPIQEPIQDNQPLQNEPQPQEDNVPIDEKFPPPVIPPFIYDENIPPIENVSPPVQIQQPKFNSVGYLRVVTTSADSTIPVPDVSVLISKIVDDKEEILYSLTTNANGETPTIELPTPNANMSQEPDFSNNGFKPYAEYNISTFLKGYFQVKNNSVPIFSGITSIQNINMIPLPIHTTERKVITFSEFEPNL